MRDWLLSQLIRAIGCFPLRTNHALGHALGWLAWLGSSRYRALLSRHLERFIYWRDGPGALLPRAFRDAAIAAQGEGITELAYLWMQPLEKVYAKITTVTGADAIDAALAAGKPIIFVSPHLGCYDMAGRYVERRAKITALYRPPKQAWLAPLMERGRVRGAATTAPANATGMRQLIRALKSGESIFLLPDQVPAAEQGGDGVWADFFGHPAYTATLLPKLARAYDCATIFVFAERLPRGAGYAIHCRTMDADFGEDRVEAARQTNVMVENLVRDCPAQYLWSYNRYKRPAGAPEAPHS